MNSLFKSIAGIAAVTLSLAIATQPAFSQASNANSISIEKVRGTVAGQYAIEQLKSDFTQIALETATPWSPNGETVVFRGPALKDVLTTQGMDNEATIEITAFNNFLATVNRDEIVDYNPILALERSCSDVDVTAGHCKSKSDFRKMEVDDGGPIYLVWPLKKLPASYQPTRNAIWVWYVTGIRPVK